MSSARPWTGCGKLLLLTRHVRGDTGKPTFQPIKVKPHAKAGLKIEAGELTVFDRRKDIIRVTFMFPWGGSGVLPRSPAV
jgi:hypothetical protein